jgi:protein SCO1
MATDRTRSRTLRLGLNALAVLAVLTLAWFRWGSDWMNSWLAADFGEGDYHLTTTEGAPFTQATLSGTASVVFFGFTHCPDVCPTTLGEISVWQEELGADADKLRVFFVTVDPERDTAELLQDYVGWLPNTQGVVGSRAEIDKAIAAFRIYARKVPLSDGSYTMDHSAYVLLFDAKGRFFEPIGYQEDPVRAMAKLRRLLALSES